jgi:glutamyl-tRNA synthetase
VFLTRLAPSPTGALHLGNARTFLVNWLLARQRGWRILLRIDDLDGPRIKADAAIQAIQDLQWLGLDWDEGPLYQSSRRTQYALAAKALFKSGRTYPCICTRREADRAASAPHADDGASVYPGTCRGKFSTLAAATAIAGKPPALRFDTTAQCVDWTDALRGAQHCNVEQQLGDFVVVKSDATPAYQLANVVDDSERGVTHVVRADDLIDSTPRQILLYQALGWQDRIPTFFHLPLVLGPNGQRLAKRHGDTRVAHYRDHGIPAARLRALLARWSGMPAADELEMPQLLDGFRLENLPLAPVVFTPADDAWLRG